MRIALAQATGTPGDVAANLASVRHLAGMASEAGARLIVLPECFATGYNIGADRLASLAEPAGGAIECELRAISGETGVAVLCGTVDRDGPAPRRTRTSTPSRSTRRKNDRPPSTRPIVGVGRVPTPAIALRVRRTGRRRRPRVEHDGRRVVHRPAELSRIPPRPARPVAPSGVAPSLLALAGCRSPLRGSRSQRRTPCERARPRTREQACEHPGISALPTPARIVEVLLGGWSAAGRARVVQAAMDGRWEAARSVVVPAAESSARALVRDAGPDDADVAVECEWLGYPLVFVGARRAGDPAGFTAGVVAVADGGLADPLEALAALAGGPPEELDHFELGAANAWRSVGPLRLWTRGDDIRALDLEARLSDHPALARCVAPVALEVSFRRPRECWLGVEVTAPSDGQHVIRAATVEKLVERIFAAN